MGASFVLSQVRTKTPHFEHLYIWWSPGNTEKQESQENIAPNLRGKLYETEFLVLKRKGGDKIYIFINLTNLPFVPLLVSILSNLKVFLTCDSQRIYVYNL